MTEYHLEADAFSRLVAGHSPSHDQWSRDFIHGLCGKFDIQGRNVMSLGAGGGFDELHFLAFENSLQLVDTLQDGPDFEKLLESASADAGVVTYLVGDCRELPPTWFGRFDVLYISGLTILELSKSDVYAGELKRFARSLRRFMTADGLLLLKTYYGGHGGESVAPLEAAGFTVFDSTYYAAAPVVELTTAFVSTPSEERVARIHEYLRMHGEHNLGRRHAVSDYTVTCRYRMPASDPSAPPA